jgi:hypothetical protein
MNVIAGGALLTLGILFGPTAFQLFALIPTVVLAGLLTFTGVHHSLLVLNVRGYDLAIALVTGLTGWATSNLTMGLAAGLLLLHAPGLATVLSRSGGNEQGYGSSRGV